MTNCVNCGAVLHGDKCEYCGTEYKEHKKKEYRLDPYTDAYGFLHEGQVIDMSELEENYG